MVKIVNLSAARNAKIFVIKRLVNVLGDVGILTNFMDHGILETSVNMKYVRTIIVHIR